MLTATGGNMRSIRAFLIATLLVCTVVSSVADAATPAQGTLSKKVKVVKWTGTFTLSQPNPVTADCVGGATDPICDHFMLKVDLPDGARIRVVIPLTDQPGDLDLHVYAPNGSLVGSSTEFLAPEAVEFRHSARFRNQPYEVRVVPWLVIPGQSYAGTAEVR